MIPQREMSCEERSMCALTFSPGAGSAVCATPCMWKVQAADETVSAVGARQAFAAHEACGEPFAFAGRHA